MKELLILALVYAFFIIASLVFGVGVYLIDQSYAHHAAGILLILSTCAVLYQFFKEFGGKN